MWSPSVLRSHTSRALALRYVEAGKLLYEVAEVPCPTLAVVDLHPVVCRALCAVTCVLCWACDVCRGIEPPRLPSARQE